MKNSFIGTVLAQIVVESLFFVGRNFVFFVKRLARSFSKNQQNRINK
jgi:hypothetical protein